MIYCAHIVSRRRGFTLIETMVAISLLTVAIVAPMSLASHSLSSAYYARDQITAFFLAQEAIEAVRAVRDAQVLEIAQTADGGGVNLFGAIPIGTGGSPRPFTIDARKPSDISAIEECDGACPPLQTDGTLYGYASGWANSNFTRTITASFVGGGQDEIRVSVLVSWKTGALQTRSFSISENLYRWVNDGSGAQ